MKKSIIFYNYHIYSYFKKYNQLILSENEMVKIRPLPSEIIEKV